MYDKQSKSWKPVSDSAMADGSSGVDRLRAEFEEADRALASIEDNKNLIDAVYQMQQLADQGYADACLAMGQMFEYGWAVAKDTPLAVEWYKKASNAGSPEAFKALSGLKKSRSRKILIAVLALIVCAGAVVFAVFAPKIFSSNTEKNQKHEISFTLPENAELKKTENSVEHGKALTEVQEKYDSPEMKKGKTATDRILLIYNGDELDLSAYNVLDVIGNDNYYVLQFDNHTDAQACLDYLNTLDGTESAEFDTYSSTGSLNAIGSGYAKTYRPVYHSQHSGYDYYTWGAEAMGFDEYAVYLQKILPAEHHLVVGVIDSGIEPQPETESRILEGHDFVGTSNGKSDYNGHGTHVSGTILDCTQGLNIDVMPISIIFHDEDGSTTKSLMRQGVEYAIEQKVDVINMSVGGPAGSGSYAFEEAVKRAIDGGICFVCAAGNESDDAADYSPSRVERCITVSAIEKDGTPAYFTNYGDAVDVCAPGVDIVSYYPQPYGKEELQGTSMASPHVAALVAMMQLEFNEDPDVISFYVKSYCRQVGTNKRYYGAGLPDGSLITE